MKFRLVHISVEYPFWHDEDCVQHGPIGVIAFPSRAYWDSWHLWLPRTPTKDELKVLQVWLFMTDPQRDRATIRVPERWYEGTKALLEDLG